MIPVCEPTLAGNELKYVSDCIKTNWISSHGTYLKKFEESFARFCNTKYAVSCSNGTTALHLALASLGIGKGDEVIIPTFTMIATANAVIYAGAKPVLVDSELETWNMDVSKIEEKIIKKTKAIMPVHTYGHPVDMDPILKLAKKHDLYVVEDAAEAHGAEYKGKMIGSLGDVGCFSFYANKIISTGEGGMITTDDKKIAEKAALLKNHAFGKPRFLHRELGYNYRMTNIQAAIGLAQMEKADSLVEKRVHNANVYTKLLKDVPGIQTPPHAAWAKNVYWMYGILAEGRATELRQQLFKKGIDTRQFFIPMHKQPVYQKKDDRFPSTKGSFPNAEYLEKNGLYLPSSSSLSPKQIRYIAGCIRDLSK